jgi:thiamine-phosphate pyrophosphorylase
VTSPASRLARPIVCLVTDRKLVGDADLPSIAAEAAAGGVTLVQLREKDLPTRELLALALRLKEALAPHEVPLVVNGRADIAIAVGAGVHLPADGIPPPGARAVLGPRPLIGRSVHGPGEVDQSAGAVVDYFVLGTIFPSPSHPGSPTLGLGAVTTFADSTVPVVAIGGIGPNNARRVMTAGAAGVAVISSILAAPDPRLAAQRLRAAVEEGWRERAATRPRPAPVSLPHESVPSRLPSTSTSLS